MLFKASENQHGPLISTVSMRCRYTLRLMLSFRAFGLKKEAKPKLNMSRGGVGDKRSSGTQFQHSSVHLTVMSAMLACSIPKSKCLIDLWGLVSQGNQTFLAQ